MKNVVQFNPETGFNAFAIEYGAIPAETRFCQQMKEVGDFEVAVLRLDMPCCESVYEECESARKEYALALVGAIGDNFENTKYLKVMNWKEAMADSRKDAVEEGVGVEHTKFRRYTVFKAVNEAEVLPDDKILDSTVAVKPKPTGEMRVRAVLRGFKQVEGKQYKKDDTSTPVICLITIRIVLVIGVMCSWYMHLIDVKGTFLNGRFQNNERIFMKVPEPFGKW